jgi:hypothetical protein
MAILFVLFSLFGVLTIVAGTDVGGRLMGVMLLLVFGCGGLAHVSGPALTRHGAVTVGRERVDTSVGSEPAFIFPSPRAKRRATAIALGGIAVGTVGMLAIMGGSAFVIAGIALLCLVAIWSLIALRRRQLLALTPTRVVVEMPAGTVEVLWDAGVDAEIYPMPTGQATRRCVTSGTDRPSAAANMSCATSPSSRRSSTSSSGCARSRIPARGRAVGRGGGRRARVRLDRHRGRPPSTWSGWSPMTRPLPYGVAAA